MSGESVSAPAHNVIPLTPIQWVICVVASLAFAADLHETLMMLRPNHTPRMTVKHVSFDGIYASRSIIFHKKRLYFALRLTNAIPRSRNPFILNPVMARFPLRWKSNTIGAPFKSNSSGNNGRS